MSAQPSSTAPIDVHQRMVGEWCRPDPVVFAPGAAPDTFLSKGGNLKLVVAVTMVNGRRLRVVTLTVVDSGFTMKGNLDISCTRLRWTNGATWTKASQPNKASLIATQSPVPRFITEGTPAEPLLPESDDKALPSCCLCLSGSLRGKPELPPPPAEMSSVVVGPPLTVEIIRARGLKGISAKSYGICCKCQIQDKPDDGSFTTHVVSSSRTPSWNFKSELGGLTAGDSLEFLLLGSPDSDAPLGRAVLASEQFHPGGFQGDVSIRGLGDGVEARLTLDVAAAGTKGRQPFLSDDQVDNVLRRFRDSPEASELTQRTHDEHLKSLIGVLNRRLREALLTFCSESWVQAVQILLDNSMDMNSKIRAVGAILVTNFASPLEAALAQVVSGLPGFLQNALRDVIRMVTDKIMEEVVESSASILDNISPHLPLSSKDGGAGATASSSS